jgi:hypothetical protein
VEADLQRYYRIDYRDRWRGDLTLRRLWVLIKHLPPDAATSTAARDGDAHWAIEAHLLDDIRMALTTTEKAPAKPHPARPRGKPKAQDPARLRKLADARRRARERRLRLQTEGGD